MAVAVRFAGACMPYMTFDYGASPSSRIIFSSYKHCAQLEPTLLHKKIQVLGLLIRFRELVLPQSSRKKQAGKGLGHQMDEEWINLSSSSLSLLSIQPSPNKSETEKQPQDHPTSQLPDVENGVYPTGLSKKEIERRRKIGAANKGKVPWTKGRKLSEEHKQLIRHRTIEALRDPKVRKKMLGHRQLHREASKEKISVALRKIWERRIVSFRSRQKVLQIWSNSIAAAAKQGGQGQAKLDWDSYDKIKADMIAVHLHNKERLKLVKKFKAATAKIVAKKLQAAERRKLQNRVTKKLKPDKLVLHRSDVQQKEVVVSTRPKLKEKLTKWHDRKKELETAISLQERKEKELRKPPLWRRTPKRQDEVDMEEKLEVPSGRLQELHLSWKDGLA